MSSLHTTEEIELLVQELTKEYQKIPYVRRPGWLRAGEHIWLCLTPDALYLASAPMEQLPLHINSTSLYDRAVVKWRLKIGK
jgi:hypothetical protein